MPVQPDRAAIARPHAEQRQRQLGAAGAQQAGDADDLARHQPQRHVVELARHRQPLDLQQRRLRAGRPRPVIRFLGDVAAGHGARDGGLVELGDRAAGDHAPGAHHGEALADVEHLAHLVADEQHRDAARLDVAHHAEQGGDLASGQGGGRLVHDQQARVGRQRPGDGDQLPSGGGQAVGGGIEIEMHAEPLHRGLRMRAHAPPADDPAPVAQLVADRQVLGDGQVPEQREVLIDHLHPEPDRVARRHAGDLGAVDQDGAAIDRVDPGNHLDQRRLARAVLAGEAVDLAGCDAERHAVQRLHAGEMLGDVAQL